MTREGSDHPPISASNPAGQHMEMRLRRFFLRAASHEGCIPLKMISYDIYTCWLIPRIRFVGYIPSLPSQTGGISRVNLSIAFCMFTRGLLVLYDTIWVPQMGVP